MCGGQGAFCSHENHQERLGPPGLGIPLRSPLKPHSTRVTALRRHTSSRFLVHVGRTRQHAPTAGRHTPLGTAAAGTGSGTCALAQGRVHMASHSSAIHWKGFRAATWCGNARPPRRREQLRSPPLPSAACCYVWTWLVISPVWSQVSLFLL